MPAQKVTDRKVTGSIVVLITCGSGKEARAIARSLVERKLVACVNVLTAPVESVYRWKGKIESAREFMVIAKTTRKRFADLRSEVTRLHSYDAPEIIALPIIAGSREYLSWLSESVAAFKP